MEYKLLKDDEEIEITESVIACLIEDLDLEESDILNDLGHDCWDICSECDKEDCDFCDKIDLEELEEPVSVINNLFGYNKTESDIVEFLLKLTPEAKKGLLQKLQEEI